MQINRSKRKLGFAIIIGFAMFGSIPSQAQSDLLAKVPIPPSPNAASLGKFVDANLGNYSGVPEISIPIHQVALKDFGLNLSLSYFAGGTLRKEQGSWVGLNWALNAGGLITRSKRDKDDFGTDGFHKVNPGSLTCSSSGDLEPDIFYFNFCGHTGKFIITYSSTGPQIVKASKSNLKISLVNGNFIVTDDAGNKYEFNQIERSKEQSVVVGSSNPSVVEEFTSSWYLTKIITVNNHSVIFNYTNTLLQIINEYRKNEYIQYLSGNTSCFTPSTSTITNVVKVTSDEVLLSSIEFPNGRIVLNTSPRNDLMVTSGSGKKLESVIVYARNSGLEQQLKVVSLSYGYFSSGSAKPANVSSRLRLNSVVSDDGSSYNIYYNGNTVEDKDVVNHKNLGYSISSNQSVIKRIVHPTQGETNYTFETNSLLDMDGVPVNSGLRIKEIFQEDGSGNVMNKYFEYHGGKFIGRYTEAIEGYASMWMPTECGPILVQYFKRLDYDLSVLGDLTTSQSIGYDKVVLYHGKDQQNILGLNGKTEFEFENTYPTQVTYPGFIKHWMPVNVPHLNGFQKKVTDFKRNTSGFSPVQIVQYQNDESIAQSITFKRRFKNDQSQSNCYEYSSGLGRWPKTIGELTTIYGTDGTSTTLNKSYKYTNSSNVLPTEIESTDGPDVVKTIYRFPGEEALISGLTAAQQLVIDELKARNMFISPLEEINIKNDNVIGQMRVDYNILAAGTLSGAETLIKPVRMKVLGMANVLEDKKIINLYDLNHGGILEEVANDGVIQSYIYTHNGINLAALVLNAKQSDIAYSSFETKDDRGNWTYAANDFTFEGSILPDPTAITGKMVYNVQYAYGGIKKGNLNSSKTYKLTFWCREGIPGVQVNTLVSSGQIRQKGDWQLMEYVFTNTPEVVIPQTQFDAYIDELRLAPVKAEMKTYTYDPHIGITSETSANNFSTYFEYDQHGRLSIVRDNARNIKKSICYNYAGKIMPCSGQFPSPDVSGYYQKLSCPDGPGEVLYVSMPAGSYFSSVSEQDAIALATLAAQQYANTHGSCDQPNIDIQGYNNSGALYYVIYTNTSTHESFTYELDAYSNLPVGSLRPGTYDIEFVPMSYSTAGLIKFDCHLQEIVGPAGVLQNVEINSSCFSIYIYL